MARKPVFPHEAFEQDKSSFLSRLFKQRVYNAEDVKNIRTSFYLEGLHNEGTALCYTLKWASADKSKDGNFVITTNQMDVKDDEIFNMRSHSCLPDDTYATCPPNDVMERLQAMDNLLRHKAEVAAPHLSPPPIYMHDSIHLSVAQKIFDHDCKKDEIEYHMQRIECMRPQKIKFG